MPPIQRWTIERIGTLRDSFDEACQHVLAESGAPDLRLELSLGPLLDLRMAEVEPGSMGWVRTLHSKTPVNPADPNTGGAIGSLYFVVVPDDGSDITRLLVRARSEERPGRASRSSRNGPGPRGPS